MTIGNLIKHKKFQIFFALAGSLAIALTIYDSVLSIKLSKIELKKYSDEHES